MLFSAALAAAGLVTQGISAAMSFDQYIKDRKMMAEAQANAKKSYNEAMKLLDVNVYDKIAINKEPYDLARQTTLQQGALALQAAGEGEARGAVGAAGLINMAVQNQERQNRADMSTEMYNLAMKSAEQQQQNTQYKTSLELESAKGAQKAAADAYAAGQKALGSGLSSLVGMGTTAASMAPDVIKTMNARRVEGIGNMYDEAVKSGKLSSNFLDASGNPIGKEQAILKSMGIDDASQQQLPIWMTVKDEVTQQDKKVLSKPMFDAWMQTLSEQDLKDINKTGFNASAGLKSGTPGDGNLLDKLKGLGNFNPFNFNLAE